jgi:hypothetical protein
MHHHTIISDRVWTSETRMICTSSVPRDRPSQKYTQYPPFRPHKTVRLAYTQRIPNLELLIIIAPLPIFSTQTSRDSLHKKHSNICTSASQSSLMQLQNDPASCGLKTMDQATSLALSQSHHCAKVTAQTPPKSSMPENSNSANNRATHHASRNQPIHAKRHQTCNKHQASPHH